MEETIRCPYCDCKVRMVDVDAEDGSCPECGAPITGTLLFNSDDAADEVSDADLVDETDADEPLDFDDDEQDY